MKFKIFRLLPSLFAYLLLMQVPHGLMGQETAATLNGRVTDPSGAAIPGVAVEVRNTETNQITAVKTDTSGNYVAPYLRPGNYAVAAEATGFKKFVTSGLVLSVAQAATLDIKLELGSITEEVNVSANAVLLDVANADRGTVVDQTGVNELPLNGRNPYMLSKLTAGVLFTGSQIYQRPFDNGAIANWSINGSVGGINGGNGNNAFLLDGAPNDAQAGINDLALVPSVDSVQEFKLQQNTYDAQYGRTMGGVINVTTKSGTNSVHGTLYEFLRRKQLDANSFANNHSINPLTGKLGIPTPAHYLDQYGGEIDGPFYIPHLYNGKNRSFFMVAYEGYREGSPVTTMLSVPYPEMVQGDFSKLTNGSSGKQITIYDPSTGVQQGNAWVRTPFPTNVIPGNKISQTAQNILSYLPKPNQVTPGVNYGQSDYVQSQTTPDAAFPNGGDPNLFLDRDSFYNLAIRLDQQFGERNHIFFRHASDDRKEYYPRYTPGPGENNSQPEARINEAYALGWVGIVSPRTVIDFRFSFSSYYDADRGDLNQGFDMTKLGFPASTVAQLPGQPFFGDYSISNYASLGEYPRWDWTHTASPQIQISHIVRNHTVRGGFDMRWINYESNGAAGAALTLSGSPVWTQANYAQADAVSGDSVASFLLAPTGGSSVYDASTYYIYRYLAPWVQDDWRVSKRLTINLGFRWDFNIPAYERYNRLDRGFNFNEVSPVQAMLTGPAPFAGFPQLMGGLQFAGVNGQPRTAADTYKKAVQPRIGFAYQITPKLVMRGGFGLYYGNPSNNYLQTIGFDTSTQVVASLDNNQTPTPNLWNNPFPNGISAPAGASLGALTYVGQSMSGGSGYFVPGQGVVNSKPLLPRIKQFSLGFQYQLPMNARIEASFVGNRGTNMETNLPINNMPLSLRQQCNQLEGGNAQSSTGVTPTTCDNQLPNPFFGLAPFKGTTDYTAPKLPLSSLNVTYPQFGSINELMTNYNKSWYNSMQLSYQQRIRGGLNLTANYTFSKFMYQNGFDDILLRIPEKSIYNQDRTHNITVGSVWMLPFGKGRALLNTSNKFVDRLVSGWENTVILTYASGAPWTLPSGVIELSNHNLNANWGGSVVQGVKPCILKWNDNGTWTYEPESVTYGCTSPNFLTTPRFAPTYGPTYDSQRRLFAMPLADVSINKTTRINERMRVQFRAEVFNFANSFLYTTSFGNSVTSSTFGQIIKSTASGSHPRYIQLGFKFLF